MTVLKICAGEREGELYHWQTGGPASKMLMLAIPGKKYFFTRERLKKKRCGARFKDAAPQVRYVDI